MNKDIRAAMLGDQDAAKRLTDAGVFIPCAHCGNIDDLRFTLQFKKDRKKRCGIYYDICTIRCNCCSASVQQAGAGRKLAEKNALLMWNTRAPILSESDMKKLRGGGEED